MTNAHTSEVTQLLLLLLSGDPAGRSSGLPKEASPPHGPQHRVRVALQHCQRGGVASVPELATLGGKQHPMDIVFPLISSNFTMDFPLLSTKNAIIYNN